MPRQLSVSPDYIQQYIRENAGKITSFQMHVETGVNLTTLRNIAVRMGVSVELNEKKERREKVERLLKKMHQTHNGNQIARRAGVGATLVYKAAVRLGITLRDDSRAPKAQPIERPGGFFNEMAKENWLI